MKQRELTDLIREARKRQDVLMEAKGLDYTRHTEDRLSNFKRNAEALGLTPEKVWGVYFGKHIDAIMTYVKTGEVSSEEIEGRIDDAINYLYLFEGLIKDNGRQNVAESWEEATYGER